MLTRAQAPSSLSLRSLATGLHTMAPLKRYNVTEPFGCLSEIQLTYFVFKKKCFSSFDVNCCKSPHSKCHSPNVSKPFFRIRKTDQIAQPTDCLICLNCSIEQFKVFNQTIRTDYSIISSVKLRLFVLTRLRNLFDSPIGERKMQIYSRNISRKPTVVRNYPDCHCAWQESTE